MARELNESIGDIISGEASNYMFSSFPPLFDIEGVISQMLDNNLAQLEALRVVAENCFRKDAQEVRLFGHPATTLLSGVELPISYYDLVEVIIAMKAGIAARRASLA